MKRKRRTEILINGSSEVVKAMADEILQGYEVKTIQEPEHGLVMMKVRETSKRSLFYLGEVLVTECKVQIQNSIGIGIIKGDQPELSRQLAIVDAAFQEELPETNGWIITLEMEEKKIQEKKEAFHQGVLKTKVNFETMDV